METLFHICHIRSVVLCVCKRVFSSALFVEKTFPALVTELYIMCGMVMCIKIFHTCCRFSTNFAFESSWCLVFFQLKTTCHKFFLSLRNRFPHVVQNPLFPHVPLCQPFPPVLASLSFPLEMTQCLCCCLFPQVMD